MSDSEENRKRRISTPKFRVLAGWWPWLPLPLLFGIMTVLWAFKGTQSHESAHLLLALNALFTFSASLVAAELARRSFLDRGSPELLLLSCGALFWGAAGLLSSMLVPYGPNTFVTVHNILVWFSSGCYLSSAVISMRPTQKLSRPGVWLGAACAGFLAITGLCVSITLSGGLPTFFVAGQGGTPLRQIVLISAIAMFGATSILLLIRSRRSKFFKWYGLGMALIAGSMWGAMVVLTPGSLLSWTVRATQYLGSLYILAAVLSVLHESRARRIPLERSLRESEAQLDAVFDVASVGVVQADPRDGSFIRFNPWFCELTGYSAEELRHMSFPDLTHPDDRRSEWELFTRAAMGEAKGYLNENRYVRKDGTVIWVSVNFTFIRNEAGRSIRTFAICEDISERKNAEAAIIESEKKYRSLFSNMNEGFALHEIILDADGNPCDYRFLELNDAFEKLTGISRGDALGKTVKEVFPGVEPSWIETYGRVALTGEPVHFEDHFIPLGRWYEVYAYSPGKNQFAVVFFDITERKRVENALRESELRFRLALRNAPVSVAAQDRDLRYVWAYNQRTAGPEDIIGQLDDHIYTPEEAARITAIKRRVREENVEVREQMWLTRPTGRIFLDVCFEPLRDEAGKVVGVGTATVDLTPMKMAEEELFAANQRLTALMNALPVGVSFSDDATCRRIAGNRAFLAQIEATPSDDVSASAPDPNAVGRRIRFFLDGRPIGDTDLPLQRAVAENREIPPMELELHLPSGRRVLMAAAGAPIRDQAGQVIGGVAVTEDITERKRLEEILRKNELEYRELVQNANSAIIRWKSDGEIVFFNEYAQEFFGYRSEEVIGQHVGLLVPHTESNGKDLAGLVRDVADHPERYLNNINENVKRDGSRVWMTWTNKPVFDENGKVKEIFAVGTDITELRRVQEALMQARDAADAASQAKSTFLANMSHEIRTPMNGVLGMTDLALMKIADPQVKEYLGYVKESGLHLLEIINDILDLARIEAGRVELCRAPFSLKELLSSTIEPLRSGFAVKKIGLTTEIDPTVQDRRMGDPGRLRQVLANLVGNALKFTDQGQVSVSVCLERAEFPKTETRLLFAVRDTGIGIPPEKIGTIFNSFEQAHNSLQSRYDGAGLGLTICKSLVEMMGGRMWVESREGVGSTFFFTAMLDVDPMAKIEIGTAAKAERVVRPLKILVAEDTRVNQVFIEAMLKKEGHEVVLAGTGRQALARLAENCFDLVLMDIRMPEMSGDEAVRVIRENPPPNVSPGIPVIALTAYALETERERFMECGFDAYLTKPMEIEKLRAVLAELG